MPSSDWFDARPLEVQVHVVLPGEAHAAVDLEGLGRRKEVGLRAVALASDAACGRASPSSAATQAA